MQTISTPSISPRMANLLNALRQLESARNSYYLASEALAGEEYAARESEEAAPAFDSAGDIIEKQIIEDIRTWAFSPGQTAI